MKNIIYNIYNIVKKKYKYIILINQDNINLFLKKFNILTIKRNKCRNIIHHLNQSFKKKKWNRINKNDFPSIK